jgi:signal transduction histidine kinase
MKFDVLSALETAGWPALVVDGAGAVSCSNQTAKKAFGSGLDGDWPQLSAIWSPDNNLTPDGFFKQWKQTPTPGTLLKFRNQAGGLVSYFTSISTLAYDGNDYLLIQLFPDNSAATAVAKNPTAEAGLAHKQKLECALQLARTVSLDFNNALTSILGHTSLVLSKMEPTHPWRGSLMEVEKSAAKAAEIANDLGTFSRQDKEARTQASGNLNLLLQRSVEFFQQNAGPELVVDWTLQLDRKLFAAKFDEAKMQQAFIKIIENSIQALRERGRITVQTRNVELNEPTQDRNVQLAAGAYVCVEISDNGCGIEPEVLPRIFEPFFTTKRGGTHRGLGLAWVYGIVTNHGGGVAVSSRPAAGASVRVYLPAEKTIARDQNVTSADLKGDQTILIVDDEDLLLTMGQTILSTYGYGVLTANSGKKALDILSKNEQTIDLVITDLVMPSMSGRELVEHIQTISPGTRIMCTSGYIWPASQGNSHPYLQKPFTSQELLLKVKHALAD